MKQKGGGGKLGNGGFNDQKAMIPHQIGLLMLMGSSFLLPLSQQASNNTGMVPKMTNAKHSAATAVCCFEFPLFLLSSVSWGNWLIANWSIRLLCEL